MYRADATARPVAAPSPAKRLNKASDIGTSEVSTIAITAIVPQIPIVPPGNDSNS